MKVNDKVICTNSKVLTGNDVAPPLTENQEYTIAEIHTCKCGKEHFNVGLPMDYNWVTCYDCKEELPDGNHWAHPSRFTKFEYEVDKMSMARGKREILGMSDDEIKQALLEQRNDK